VFAVDRAVVGNSLASVATAPFRALAALARERFAAVRDALTGEGGIAADRLRTGDTAATGAGRPRVRFEAVSR